MNLGEVLDVQVANYRARKQRVIGDRVLPSTVMGDRDFKRMFRFRLSFNDFLAPPLPFGQMRSSISWVLHLLTVCLSVSLCPCVPVSSRKLEISVNIDARTLKFCMRHPWTHSLRFRENQIVCMSLSLLVGLLSY